MKTPQQKATRLLEVRQVSKHHGNMWTWENTDPKESQSKKQAISFRGRKLNKHYKAKFRGSYKAEKIYRDSSNTFLKNNTAM